MHFVWKPKITQPIPYQLDTKTILSDGHSNEWIWIYFSALTRQGFGMLEIESAEHVIGA